MFITDELNLSSVSNMNALGPAFETNLNISINFPGIEKPILIHPNFFFFVCRNEVGTKEEILYLRTSSENSKKFFILLYK